jgi:alpha-tubulin suppressor-like RCC1 family protein
MMSTPSAKKQRRAVVVHATSPAPAAPQQSSFLDRMNQLKDLQYQRLYKQFFKVLHTLSDDSSTSNESMRTTIYPMEQDGVTYELRQNMNEYVRIARLIDSSFDVTGGRVMGMGSNESLQLMPGSNDNDDVNDDVKSNTDIPPTYLSLVTREIRAVSAGGTHSIALATNGIPYTWGSSDLGVLGTTTVVIDGNPAPVTGFHTTYHDPSNNICEDGLIHQVSAGDAHSLFLSINGNVYQCGVYLDSDSTRYSDDDRKKVVDIDPQKEKGVFGFNPKPVHVHQLPQKAIAISAGKGFNAAILEDHTLVTWGEFFFLLHSFYRAVFHCLFFANKKFLMFFHYQSRN